MTREELSRLDRYTKKRCLHGTSLLARMLIYTGAIRVTFDGDWNYRYCMWHPIGLSLLLVELLINIILYGVTSLRWSDYSSREGLSFWRAPRG